MFMKKHLLIFFVVLLATIIHFQAWATNGTQAIGTGPISSSMGGTGITNPQSGISAIYLNPAAMTSFDKGTFDFGASFAVISVDGTASTSSGTSRYRAFPLPSIGVIKPLGNDMALGLGVVAVGGMGTDYRNTKLNSMRNLFIMQMDFIPAFAIKFAKMFSVGISFPFSFQVMDFGSSSGQAGADHAFGLGLKLGADVDLKMLSIGAYAKFTLLKPDHEVGFQTSVNTAAAYSSRMKLAPPTELGLGVSTSLLNKSLVLSLNGKYILWSSADGYGNSATFTTSPYGFNWKDQIVILFGVQYKISIVSIRAGYNYGSKVLNDATQSNLLGSFNVRAPATIQHHITFGVGFDVGKNLSLDLGMVYGIKGTYSGTLDASLLGGTQGVAVSSSASNSIIDIAFGLSGKF